jgi:hypothetical protein
MNRLIGSTVLIAVMSVSGPALAQSLHGILYKNPYCTCCESHAAYFKEQGINVEVKVVDDLSAFNSMAGMPSKFEGCHTIMLNGYAIEGHVSAEIIDKLVKEHPADVVGISLPGMPLGVPGMEGEKEGPYQVFAIHKDGSATVYATQ